jgi:hypothetical protein
MLIKSRLNEYVFSLSLLLAQDWHLKVSPRKRFYYKWEIDFACKVLVPMTDVLGVSQCLAPVLLPIASG